MAKYSTDYMSDFGKVYKKVGISSRLVTSDGTSSKTSSTFDLPYLPSTFTTAVNTDSACKSCCSLIIKPRAVKLWLDEKKYLYLPHPFQPATNDYLAFVSELNGNDQILFIERVGEKLDDFYTNLLT